jgi:putative SOS response-associated peptidase YedK
MLYPCPLRIEYKRLRILEIGTIEKSSSTDKQRWRIRVCERYTLSADVTAVQDLFQVSEVQYHYQLKSTVKPKEQIPAILPGKMGRSLEGFRWGLFPFWAKDSILADGHDVYYKRAFDRILRKQRCIVPCTGFYGWSEPVKGKESQAVKIKLKDQPVFALAGLYDEWVTPHGERLRTCTIVTTPVNRVTADYMTKMPMVLEDDSMETWLDNGMQDKKTLKSMFLPISEMKLDVEFAQELMEETMEQKKRESRWQFGRVKQ